MSNNQNQNSAMADALKAATQKQPKRDANANKGQEQQATGQQHFHQQSTQDNFDFAHQSTHQSQGADNMSNQEYSSFNWAEFDNFIPAGMDLQSAGANLSAISEAMAEVAKDPSSRMNIKPKFQVIDAVKYGVGLPSVVTYAIFNSTVYAHVLLVADRELEPRQFRDYMNRPIDVTTTPGDVYSQDYIAVVQEAVRQTEGEAISNVIVVGAAVLPRNVDPENTQQMRLALYTSSTAIMTTARTQLDPNANYFNYDQHLAKTTLRTRMDFSDEVVVDHLGGLHRSDIRIDMSRQQPGRDQYSATTTVPLTQVSGYIDLHYVDMQKQMQAQMMNPMMNMGMNMPFVPSYLARFIMTHVASKAGAKTMELMLLGLSSANIVLFGNSAWKNAFKPNTARQDHDRRDLGAIGFDVPTAMDNPTWRGRIPTKSAKFDDQALAMLISASVAPNLGFAIDCEVAGPDSWLTNVWARAAEGHDRAIKRVIDAANNLTNGRFQNKLNMLAQQNGGNVVLFSPEIQKIHLGTYVDPVSGETRDLRDWDELAMLNYLGENDLARAQAFGSTYDQSNMSEEERLEERLRIIRAVANQVNVTGYALRVTPSAALIQALGAALSENKSIQNQPEIVGLLTEQAVRGQSNLYNYASSGMGTNNMFNMNMNNQANTGGFGTYSPFV